jgi:hypothetical protein
MSKIRFILGLPVGTRGLIMASVLGLLCAGVPVRSHGQAVRANCAMHEGTISPAGDSDSWTVAAGAGNTLTLRVGATNFPPRIRVFAPDNALVAEVISPSSFTRDIVLIAAATNSGNYTVLVSSQTPAGTGTYGLHLAQVPAEFVVSAGDEGGPLINGANNPGLISLGDLDMWSFAANAGDTISLRMGASDFPPRIRLYDPDGALAGEVIPPSSFTRDVFLRSSATNPGTYIAVVDNGTSGGSGAYNLHLAQVPGSFVVSPGDEGGALTNGANNAATISLGDLDVWSFAASTGDNISLRMGATTFPPRIRLYAPNGALAGEAISPSSFTRDVFLTASATNAGTFTVVVDSTVIGTSGDYNLHLAQIPGSFVVSPGDEGGALQNGASHPGMIASGDLDLWSFTANQGDTISLRMGTTAFPPRIRLYAPNGALAGEAVSASSFTRDVFLMTSATNAGDYTVVVDSTTSGTSGDYDFHFLRLPGEFIVSPGDEGGDLENGAVHPGTIANGDLDIWSFTAEAGDGIMLRMGSPSFPPRIRLYDPNGGLAAEAVSPSSFTRDVFLSASATNSGSYTVVVDCTTSGVSGSYDLHLARAPAAFIVSENDQGGPLMNGATNLATLTVGDLDLWSFVGTVGDSNVLAVATPSFAPWVRLYGPNGNLVRESVPASSFTRAATLIHELTNNPGNYTVVISAGVAGQSGEYTLKQSRWAPDLNVPDASEIHEGETLTVSLSAQDPDEPAKPLQFTLLSAPPGATLAILNATNAAITWETAEATGPTTNLFVASVTDVVNGRAFIRTNSFTTIVREVNLAPSLSEVPNQEINELTPLNITASATDPDLPANPLTFSLISPPPGMTIDPNTGAIAWTPTEAQGPLAYPITLVVTDDSPFAVNERNLGATNLFTVTVREVNTAPQLAGANQTIDEGMALGIPLIATDSDLPANPLTFSLMAAPAGVQIDPSTGFLTWTPDESQGPSTNEISVMVTDDSPFAINEPRLNATVTLVVIVNEVNSSPMLGELANRTVNELATFTLTNAATDADLPRNVLSYALVSAPAGATMSATGVITWTPAEVQGPSTNTFTTIVTDDGVPARTATNSFTLVVNEVNAAPVLAEIAAQTAHFGTLISVQPLVTDSDLPTNTLVFTIEGNPPGMTLDAATGAISWIPTETQVGNYSITLRVTDDGSPSLSATRAFPVAVTGAGSTLEIARLAAGLLQLIVTGDPGRDYELQRSSNLIQWERVLQFPLTDAPYQYVEPESTAPRRFYRLELVQ